MTTISVSVITSYSIHYTKLYDSNELRDSTLSIRMLPLGSPFSTYRRLVRDLSSEVGKAE